MDTCGAIIGPAIALLVFYFYGLKYPSGSITNDTRLTGEAFRTVFWISMIPGITAVFFIIIFVKEKIRPQDLSDPNNPDNPKSSIRQNILNTDFKKFLIIVSIFTLGNSSTAFIILKIQDAGAVAFNVTVLYLLYNTVYSISSIPAGIAADHFGKKRMILLSYILFGLIYFGFALSRTQTHVWLLFLTYGIFMGISEGIQRAYVAVIIPNNFKATGYGIYHTVTGILALPSSFIAGILWDMKGPSAAFLFGTVTAIIASFLFLIFFWKKNKIRSIP